MFDTYRKMEFEKGFTLIEIMVVVVILGIAASVVVLSSAPAREYNYDKLTVANLRTIAQANKLYYSRHFFYYPFPAATVTNLTQIINNLSIDISPYGWIYTMDSLLGTNGNNFRVNATRVSPTGANLRRLSITDTMVVSCTAFPPGVCYETNFTNI